MPLKNINLMGKNPNQPFDIQTEQARLAKAQEVANLLLGQALTGTDPPTFHTSPGNPFGRDIANFAGPLGRVVDRWNSQKDLEGINTKQAQLAQIIAARNADEMDQYTSTRFGGQDVPGTDIGPPTAEGERPPMLKSKGDVVAAMRTALMSQNPELKKIGMEDLKGMVGPKDLLSNLDKVDPTAGREFMLNPNAPLRGPKKTTVERDALITTQDGDVQSIQPVQMYEVGTFNGVPGVKSKLTDNVVGLSGGNTTPDKDLERQYNTTALGMAKEGLKAYQENVGMLADIGQVREDIKATSADKFGAISKVRNWLNRSAELIDPSKKLDDTANFEAVVQGTGQFILANARKLAPVTKSDTDLLETILGGPSITKDGLLRAMDVMEKATTRAISEHQARVDAIPRPPGVTYEQHRALFAPSFSFTSLPPARSNEKANAIRRNYGLPDLP